MIRTMAERRQHTAATVDPGAADYDHATGDRVMTCDGHPGTITAVITGPFPGTESYRVDLDDGLGGGDYAPGQIWALPAGRTAGTAAADYPELARILAERPDPARGITTSASASRLDPETEARLARSWTAHNDAILQVNRNGHRMRWLGAYDDLGRADDARTYKNFAYWRAHCPECGMAMRTDIHGESRAEPDRRHPYGLDSGCGSAYSLSMQEPSEPPIGDVAHEPDDIPLHQHIGPECVGCHTPMNREARDFGCVFCSKHDHHSYCCPNPDGHTAAWHTAGATCLNCADTTPGRTMMDCPTCGDTHHATPTCCSANCADCGARLGAGQGSCAHCGMWGHHDGCCTSICGQCGQSMRTGGQATCPGCDHEQAGHHPGCCPIQPPMGYRAGDDDLCPGCATTTGLTNHPLYGPDELYCDSCGTRLQPPRRRFAAGILAAFTASAEMSLGETIVPAMTPHAGPTRPRSPHDNPASSGWASAPDPDQWSAAPLYPLDSRVGSGGDHQLGGDLLHGHDFVDAGPNGMSCRYCGDLVDERPGGAYFHLGDDNRYTRSTRLRACPYPQRYPFPVGEEGYEPDNVPIEHSIGAPCEHCKTPMSSDASTYGCPFCNSRAHHGYCCPNLDGHTATFHEEPEAALPTTDGTVNADDADPEALNPMEFTAFLADFQTKAAHLDPRRTGGGGTDVAQAAAAFLNGAPAGGLAGGLSKAAMRDFTPAEQRVLIEEAPTARAGNADRLDLTGTHYADLAAMVGDEEDDGTWLL